MIANEASVISNSLWTATANKTPDYPSLEEEINTQVVIVGAGYTGLSAALHLVEKGVDVVVLEAETPGWGASGRNGGQVNPGLQEDPEQIIKDFGHEMGERMIKLSGSAPDLVFSLIEKHNIKCDAVRSGWMRPAHTKKALNTLQSRVKQLEKYGAPMRMLDHDEMSNMLGSSMYIGGSIDVRGGNIHPLNYALGLAGAATKAGAKVFGASRVTHLKHEDGKYLLEANKGRVKANKVLLCTNGYTDRLASPLSKTIVPVRSTQVATVPLSNNIAKSILPGLQAPSDLRRLLLYFRKDAHGRFIMGGRGSYSDKPTQHNQQELRDWAIKMFPQLEGVEWQYAWGGFIAMTQDHYPHLNLLDDNIAAGLGYNGRGVAMATAMGKVLADWAHGTPESELDFAVTKARSIPFHTFYKLGVAAEVGRSKLMDWLGL